MRCSALAFGIASVLAFGQADAAGFQLKENSVKAMGRAFAGSAIAPGDTSVVVNNPAAMSQFTQNAAQVDINAIDFSAQFSGSGTTAVGTPLSGGNGGDAGDATPVPAISAIFPLGDSRVTVGAMISAPFGLKTNYDADWVGRYHALKSELKTVDLTLSGSLAVTDRFSVGVGLIYERAEATLSNAIDFGTALCAGSGNVLNCFNPAYPFRPQNSDGSASVHGDDTGFGWLVGLSWHPTDSLAFGYSHRSEIDHDLAGDVDFTVPGSVAAVLGATGQGAAYSDQPVSAPLTTPSIDTLSASYAFSDRFTLLADVSRTDWHSLRNVTIYRANGQVLSSEAFNWKDTTFYSLGAEFKVSDTLALRAGLAHDQTPTNDVARTPRLPDQNRNWVSVGVTWMATPALEISGGYSRIMIKDPTINGVRSSSGSRLTGKYSADVNLLGISAQYRF